ncbi:MAG: polysaccharide biosynthesis protein [Phascolarctobacterium sp.]|nr:polysaccharide biosynthesis protein [Phascolarctobacterium sp.]
MSKDKFLRGALVLTAAGLMVKIIGSVNRILLSRLLGGEGIGLYQMAYPVYLLLLSISSAGIPIAISILVSERVAKNEYRSVRHVFSTSIKMMAGVGLVLAILLYLAAGWSVSTGIVRDPRAYYALIALTPAIFFASILACFRGFFQGWQLMTPPAVSQIVEQFVRVCTMIVLAYLLLPHGLEYAAAGAAFGAVPGSLTGILVLGYFYKKYNKSWREKENLLPVDTPLESTGKLIKRMLLLALPVSLANVMVPVSSSVDMLIVPNRLVDVGYSIKEATTLFGYLAGMAQPLIMMATIPTLSLAASLVPAISEAFTLKDFDIVCEKSSTAMKLCCLITVPAAVGMVTLATPISVLLYGTAKAATAICHSGPAIWLLGMQQITAGMLQGTGNINLPMIHMVIGIIVKVFAVYFLTNATFNIVGAAWATNISFALIAFLNIWALSKLGIKFKYGAIMKIVFAAISMGIFCYVVEPMVLGYKLLTILAVVMAGVIYVVMLCLLGVLNKEEASKLPILKKFIK